RCSAFALGPTWIEQIAAQVIVTEPDTGVSRRQIRILAEFWAVQLDLRRLRARYVLLPRRRERRRFKKPKARRNSGEMSASERFGTCPMLRETWRGLSKNRTAMPSM